MKETQKTIIEKPGLVKIVFDYPFHLGLQDFYYPVKIDNGKEIGMIKLESREGVQILDKNQLLRKITEERKNKGPKLESLNKVEKRVEIVGYGENDHPLFFYEAGEYGKAVYPWFYSRVEIIFPVNHVYAAWTNPKNSQYIINLSNKFFNRLLDSYRHISNDIYNKYLSSEKNDFVQYRAIYISEYTEEEKQGSIIDILKPEYLEKRKFIPFPMRDNQSSPEDFPLVQASISSPLMMNAKKPKIDNQKMLNLLIGKGGLIKGPEVHNKALLTGLERLGFDKDYRMAIVEFDTAVEICVSNYIFIILLTYKKMKEEEIEELFDETRPKAKDLRRKGEGYLTTMSRITRLEELFTQLSGNKFNIRNTKEFNDWYLLTRKKRNQCVHFGKDFGKKDAEGAFIAAQKFIRYIEKIANKLNIKI
jgi:hypothetical protein